MQRRLTVALLDSVVDLDVPLELHDRLSALLPPRPPSPATAAVCVERHDGGYVVRGPAGATVTPDVAAAVDRVLEICNGTAVQRCTDFAVHAGVVSRDGVVVALPASSGVGKSTLVACLLRAGWSYVSDEALVLTSDGDVRPYPKWLSLHRWTLDRLELPPPEPGREERAAAAAELGAAVSSEARLRLTDVVVPARTSGAASLTRLSAASGAAELLRYSFNHYRDPVGSLAVVSGVGRQCRAWALAVADPVEAAELMTTSLPAVG